jgi:hypothetical protein
MNTTTLLINQTVAIEISLESAIVLNQIEYWIKVSGRSILNQPGKWIYNSLEEWHKQFSFWSLSKLRRIIKSLEDSGLIISKKINANKWNQTKWYTLDYQALNKLIGSEEFQENKKTNRFVQNEQMLLKKTKNNYTNKSSYKREEEFLKIKKHQKEVSKSSEIKKSTISQEQLEIAQQLVQIWNEHFECSLNPLKAFINKHVAIQLNKILQTKFKNDLEKWKLYAQTVSSSKFLMGEKKTKSNFKAQFLWLIKEETIDSIQNGAYGVGDRILDSEKIEENLKVCQKEIQQMVQTKMTERVQEQTPKGTEEQEFKKYLINREYKKDGDQYLIGKHMESIGSEYMYGGYITPSHVFYPGNERYKQRLFQSYLMKKYYGIDETILSNKIDTLCKNKLDKSGLFKTLKDIKKKISNIEIFTNKNFDSFFVGEESANVFLGT